jgi:uncharacterized membrane protein
VMIQGVILATCLGYRPDMSRWMGAAIGFLFAAMGYGMKDLPRNHLAGIRVPWTLASDEAWRVSHQRASKIVVVGGLAGALISMVGAGMVGLAVSVGAMLSTLVDSYRVTRPGRLGVKRASYK